MIKVDVISGFLGAGKTTLIKKLLSGSMGKEKVVLIENEFGEIGIDGSFLKESGIEIKEIKSGCIWCSLVGDFSSSMKEIVEKFSPDRIIIEPSGVGKLSDIIGAIEKVEEDLKINIVATVVDGGKDLPGLWNGVHSLVGNRTVISLDVLPTWKYPGEHCTQDDDGSDDYIRVRSLELPHRHVYS